MSDDADDLPLRTLIERWYDLCRDGINPKTFRSSDDVLCFMAKTQWHPRANHLLLQNREQAGDWPYQRLSGAGRAE